MKQSNVLSGSVTIERLARECHNKKYIQKVQQSKVLQGGVTIKSTARQCNNHKDSQGMPQTKVHQSKVYTNIVSIKSTYREFTMKSTDREYPNRRSARECHTKTYCLEVLQFKIHTGNATIKCTAREYHKLKGLQGRVTTKRLPGKITIKITTNEYQNQKDCREYNN